MDEEKIIKFNKDGKLIYLKKPNKHEEQWKYDENNNIIYHKYFDEKRDKINEFFYKYDKNNNLIYYKNEIGEEERWEYDENNNELYYKDSNGYELWNKYDKNDNLMYRKSSSGNEDWYKYDKDGKCTEILEKEFLEIEYAKKHIKNSQKEKVLEKNIKINKFEIMDI